MSAAPQPQGVPVPRRAGPHRFPTFLVLLLGAVGLLGWSSPTSSATEHEPGLVVEVTEVSPAFLVPGQPLTVAGTVTNGSATELDGIALDLRLQRAALGSRFAMDVWLDPDADHATLELGRQAIDAPLAPGSSTDFTFTVPAEDLPLPATPASWGPRGLLVGAATGAGTDRTTDDDRTLLVWLPGLPAAPTRVSVVVPLVATAGDLLGSVLAGVGLPEQTEGRVSALAEATADHPAVAWALDPALLVAAPVGPASTTSPPTSPAADAAPSASPGGTAEAETTPQPAPDPEPGTEAGVDGVRLPTALQGPVQGREVLALPYADADAAALTHRDRLGLFDVAVDTGVELFAAAGLAPLDGIGWPAGAQPDRATVGALADRGARAVILPEASVPLRRELTYTPTGRATVLADRAGEEGVAALLAEDMLSAALAGRSPHDDAGSTSGAALAARQYLLGLTAMVSRERPADVQHLLAVLPRTFDGDPAHLAGRIDVLADAPWVELSPVSALIAAPNPAVTEADLPAEAVAQGEIPAELLDEVLRARTALADFATIAADPELLVRDEQLRLLQVASAAWRADPGGRSSFWNVVRAAAAEVPTRVGVLATGTVNLISETGGLPVTVRNGLDQPITAQLRLTPQGPSIRLPELVPVELPAGSEVAVPVPVSAVGSADIEVDAQLVDGTGRPVGEPATLYVRVRADWENVGTALLAAVVAVTFVVGLIRSIRRAHRRRAALPSAGSA